MKGYYKDKQSSQQTFEDGWFKTGDIARIDEINQNLPPYSTIKYFALVAREFSIDGGELTPTLKLKRKEIYSKYKQIIEELYNNNGNGLGHQFKTINGEEK